MAARRMEIIRRLFCLCLCLTVCLGAAVSVADAAMIISPDKDCSLTIYCRHDGVDVSGVTVQLYKVADVTDAYQYTLTSDFQSSGLVLNGIKSSAEWNVVRSTLESYISAQNIGAAEYAVTGQNGGVCFEGLKPGLYFAETGSAIQNSMIYTFESALVSIPGIEGSNWQYDVAVTCKSQATPMSPPYNDPIRFKVLKLWKGDSGQETRPDNVEIEIFRNGVSYKTVILSEANNWSHTWTAKADGSDWTVVERNIPEGYALTVTEKDTSFVLTNTLTPETPENPEDPDPEDPDNEDPGNEDPEDMHPGGSDDPNQQGQGDDPTADTPKTGDTSNLLLYMIIMFISGSLLIILGITGKRKKNEQ